MSVEEINGFGLENRYVWNVTNASANESDEHSKEKETLKRFWTARGFPERAITRRKCTESVRKKTVNEERTVTGSGGIWRKK